MGFLTRLWVRLFGRKAAGPTTLVRPQVPSPLTSVPSPTKIFSLPYPPTVIPRPNLAGTPGVNCSMHPWGTWNKRGAWEEVKTSWKSYCGRWYSDRNPSLEDLKALECPACALAFMTKDRPPTFGLTSEDHGYHPGIPLSKDLTEKEIADLRTSNEASSQIRRARQAALVDWKSARVFTDE